MSENGTCYSVATCKLPFHPSTMSSMLTFLHQCLLVSAQCLGDAKNWDLSVPLEKNHVVKLKEHLSKLGASNNGCLDQYLTIIRYGLSSTTGVFYLSMLYYIRRLHVALRYCLCVCACSHIDINIVYTSNLCTSKCGKYLTRVTTSCGQSLILWYILWLCVMSCHDSIMRHGAEPSTLYVFEYLKTALQYSTQYSAIQYLIIIHMYCS